MSHGTTPCNTPPSATKLAKTNGKPNTTWDVIQETVAKATVCAVVSCPEALMSRVKGFVKKSFRKKCGSAFVAASAEFCTCCVRPPPPPPKNEATGAYPSQYSTSTSKHQSASLKSELRSPETRGPGNHSRLNSCWRLVSGLFSFSFLSSSFSVRSRNLECGISGPLWYVAGCIANKQRSRKLSSFPWLACSLFPWLMFCWYA